MFISATLIKFRKTEKVVEVTWRHPTHPYLTIHTQNNKHANVCCKHIADMAEGIRFRQGFPPACGDVNVLFKLGFSLFSLSPAAVPDEDTSNQTYL